MRQGPQSFRAASNRAEDIPRTPNIVMPSSESFQNSRWKCRHRPTETDFGRGSALGRTEKSVWSSRRGGFRARDGVKTTLVFSHLLLLWTPCCVSPQSEQCLTSAQISRLHRHEHITHSPAPSGSWHDIMTRHVAFVCCFVCQKD